MTVFLDFPFILVSVSKPYASADKKPPSGDPQQLTTNEKVWMVSKVTSKSPKLAKRPGVFKSPPREGTGWVWVEGGGGVGLDHYYTGGRSGGGGGGGGCRGGGGDDDDDD